MCVTAALMALPPAAAAHTSFVFGPDVEADSRALDLRTGFVRRAGRGPEVLQQRVHYQQAVNDAWRPRLIAYFSSGDERDWRFDGAQLEVLWQYREDERDGWDAAWRFSATDAATADVPDAAQIAWSAQRTLRYGWRVRTNLLATRTFGGGPGGWLYGARGELSRKLGQSTRVGAELFSSFDHLTGTSRRRVQLGPAVSWTDDALSFGLGYLHGLTDAASDSSLRLSVALAL